MHTYEQTKEVEIENEVRYDEDKFLNKEEVIKISKEVKFIQYFDEWREQLDYGCKG